MKKKPKSEFLALAERIAEDISAEWFLCLRLSNHKRRFLRDYFAPTEEECYKYNVWDGAWCSARVENTSTEQEIKDNSFRILILCFADLLWKDLSGEKREAKSLKIK